MAVPGLACLLAGLLTACETGEEEPAEEREETVAAVAEDLDPELVAALPQGVTAEMAAAGRELYTVCVPCHGFDARGTQLGPSLRDDEWIHGSGGFEEIVAVIRDGVAEPEEFEIPMPVLGGGDFSPEQLRSVAAYVFALGRTE